LLPQQRNQAVLVRWLATGQHLATHQGAVGMGRTARLCQYQ
jgi:hypothetical protein